MYISSHGVLRFCVLKRSPSHFEMGRASCLTLDDCRIGWQTFFSVHHNCPTSTCTHKEVHVPPSFCRETMWKHQQRPPSLLFLVLLLLLLAQDQATEASDSFDKMENNSTTSNATLAPSAAHSTTTTMSTTSPTPGKTLTLGLINGDSSFFEPVAEGFLEQCEEWNNNIDLSLTQQQLPRVECQVRIQDGRGCKETDVNWNDFFYNHSLDGLVTVPCHNETNMQWWMDRFNDKNKERSSSLSSFPVITFDSDAPSTSRLAYVGTDQEFLGSTMARLLRQMRPSGGTYAIVAPKDGRDQGFIREILKYNHDDSKGHWYPVQQMPPYPGGGAPGYREQMEGIADLNDNVTAIVIMKQTPMKHVNWTQMVRSIKAKHPHLVIIGTDGSDYQLDYLHQRHVDGLVGQLPHEMGSTAAQTLLDLLVHDIIPPTPFIPTNLVAYNLIPIELPELSVDQNLLGNFKYLGFVAFGIVALSFAVCLLWTIRHRKSRVVAAAQPTFLILIATGILIFGSSLIPLSFDDDGSISTSTSSTLVVDSELPWPWYSELHNDHGHSNNKNHVTMCMFVPWLACTGFATVFSALFAKTWRVNQIFRSGHQHARIVVQERHVLLPLFLLLSCNFGILTLWTVLDPLTYHRLENEGTDYWNRVLSTYGTCRSENAAAYLVPLAMINFTCVVTACWQAYQARSLESEFAESNYIGWCVASMLQAFLTGLPVILLVKDSPQPFYVMVTLMVFLLSMTILLLIFLPKMLLQREYSGQSEQDQRRQFRSAIRRSTQQPSHRSGSSEIYIGQAFGRTSSAADSSNPMTTTNQASPPAMNQVEGPGGEGLTALDEGPLEEKPAAPLGE